MKNKTIIDIKNVSKEYILHHEKPTLIESVLSNRSEKFRALKNINLKIHRGDIIGIVGPNGSGKTTLLKIIAGITSPSKGSIKTNGKIISLIDLEAGFHPDLTGEENIYINAMLLGMNKKEISSKMNDIKEFADIGDFIDSQLYTYSQGMKLRLGFSIVAQSNPDVLLLDESFNVGDVNFQRKAINKIKEFNDHGAAIVIVSHWIDFIKKNCKKIIIIDKGKITFSGRPEKLPKKAIY